MNVVRRLIKNELIWCRYLNRVTNLFDNKCRKDYDQADNVQANNIRNDKVFAKHNYQLLKINFHR